MAVPDSNEPPKRHIFTSRHYENLVRLMVRLSEQYIRSQRKREERAVEAETPSGCVAEWTGDDAYFLRGRRDETTSREEIFRPSKRPRLGKKNGGNNSRSNSFDGAPDEILTAIFGSVPSARDRSSCASVCKRWLMLLTHMRTDDFKTQRDSGEQHGLDDSDGSVNQPRRVESLAGEDDFKLEKQPLWAIGDLSRCLEGKKATDVRLASIAVGTAAHGGLWKLIIRGGAGERSAKGVTDVGLTAIGTCCNALRSLTLWDCPSIGDSSLKSIGSGCRLLENLDILKCPNVGDAGMQAIASGCLRLSNLSIEACEGIGDAGVQAVAENCSNLLAVTLSRCQNIGNTGVVALIQHCKTLRKLKLEKIGVTDEGLASLAHHCKSLTKLVLSGLDKVTQKGFISLVLQSGLKSLKVLVLNGCRGVTDTFLSSFGKAFKELKGLRLIDCEHVSDTGLQGFVEGCRSLKGLHLEKTSQLSYRGLQACLRALSSTLKTLHISKCSGIQDSQWCEEPVPVPILMTSLSLTYCETAGDRCLSFIGRSFPLVEQLDLSGITGITDEGLSAFLEASGRNLVSLSLRDCSKLTDEAVLKVASKCWALQLLVLDGCWKVTDRSMSVLASQCTGIQELDISRCSISDAGLLAVLISLGPSLRTLSLAGCEGITDESLSVIQRMCDSLSALNLKNCRTLSSSALDKLEMELGKRCDILLP